MASVYVTRLWLTCDSTQSSVLQQFDLRWTPAIQRDWQTLVFAVDPAKSPGDNDVALCKFLNDQIVDKYVTNANWIKNDVNAAVAPTSFQNVVPVFDVEDWSVGVGGVHESNRPVNAAVTGSGQVQWRVPNQNQTQFGYIFAHCAWSLVNVDTD